MMKSAFRPTPESSRAFRDALGCFGTGVTVVTCRDAQGPLAMTANSFAAVSLDPALVLWSVAKISKRYNSFMAATEFAIHILHEGQHHLAVGLARDGRAVPADTGVGVPILEDCLVRFDCKQHATYDAGDHSIILGQVTDVLHGHGAPLMFTQGQFGGFSPN